MKSGNYISLHELSALVELEYQTLLGQVRAGTLRPIKVGSRWRVYEDELKRYLVSRNYCTDEEFDAALTLYRKAPNNVS